MPTEPRCSDGGHLTVPKYAHGDHGYPNAPDLAHQGGDE